MHYSLVCIMFDDESDPRGVLCRAEEPSDVKADIEQRFGVGNVKISDSGVLTDMPEVGDPGMEALYKFLATGLRIKGSVPSLVALLLGDAIVLGYMVCKYGGGKDDSSSGEDRVNKKSN